ncbi:MAG: alpha/beta fold hydrolase [Solirubrobacteraceae bacterium]
MGLPGLKYEVNGSFLYLLCMESPGTGSPTVILEAGLGEDHRDWAIVQPEIARTTRVCSYDRSGLGFSEDAPKRASAQEKVSDLHALLAAAGVPGPYVLVGHSYGGMLVHVYAATYPGDVAGLVLLDSSHPDQISRFLATLPPQRTGEPQALSELRKGLKLQATTSNPEGVNWKESSDQARAAGSVGKKPLIVVTAGEFDSTGLTTFPSIVHRAHRAWLRMQDDLARLSTDSRHVIAVYSPHFVMSALGQPELVTRAVDAVVQAARAGTQLPHCRALFAPPAAKCVGAR